LNALIGVGVKSKNTSRMPIALESVMFAKQKTESHIVIAVIAIAEKRRSNELWQMLGMR
jgi:hypothetical protein